MNIKKPVTFILFLSLITVAFLLLPGEGLDQAQADISLSLPAPYLVKNINTTTPSSDPACMIAFDDFMICEVDDGIHGVELWRSDGTPEGSFLLKDIYPGSRSSHWTFPTYEATRVGNVVFFAADDKGHGHELWITDGTSAGTVLVKDITPGADYTPIFQLTAVGDRLYFTVTYRGAPGDYTELWISDGTAEGTRIVTVLPGSSDRRARDLTAVGDTLFFSNDDGVHGRELWRSDGTDIGTMMVKDIDPSDDPYREIGLLTAAGDLLYFPADDGEHGRELWLSDGTETGTVMVRDINSGPEPSKPAEMVAMNNHLFFTAATEGARGVWRSDGTNAGTILMKAVPASRLIADHDHLYLVEREYEPVSSTIWISDGTSTGTDPISKLDGAIPYDEPFLIGEDRLFFELVSSGSNTKIYTSDGTTGGTKPIERELHWRAQPDLNLLFREKAYFSASDSRGDRELWVTDGSESGTVRAVDFNRSGDADSQILFTGPILNDGKRVFLRAVDTSAGAEVMISDGTTAGTKVLSDIFPGPDRSYHPEYWEKPIILSNGLIFFEAEDSQAFKLWTTDGTESGTKLLESRCAGGYYGSPRILASTERKAVFSAVDSCSTDRHLWLSDGTSDGTYPIILAQGFDQIIASADHIYILLENRELWGMKDKELSPSLLSDSVYETPVVFQDELYFIRGARGVPSKPDYLWKTDGTASGTKEIWQAQRYIIRLKPTEDALYLDVRGTTVSDTLWKTDGTSAGTNKVAGGLPFDWSLEHTYTTDNYTLFITGSGLWRSDGPPEEAHLVIDSLNFDVDPEYPTAAAVGELLFFSADDGAHGYELWVSDGTRKGTQMVADIFPGRENGSGPAHLVAGDNILYFEADDGRHGRELWALNLLDEIRYSVYLPGVVGK